MTQLCTLSQFKHSLILYICTRHRCSL